ncbi:unnamed protein product [Rodentolepis nana]|uniref:DUF3995 domain-containing protein n=1 Tax=Rodentolepis nana TaxID=102285 RepID=A0A0R3T636_RODNA|nr:unnamed protein product [Rodentolepis nana]
MLGIFILFNCSRCYFSLGERRFQEPTFCFYFNAVVFLLLQANCCWVRVVNLLLSGLAIFHLAYLAVMFDTSEQQDKGYNMLHVLKKWSDLYFLSHIIAALTYLLSLVL